MLFDLAQSINPVREALEAALAELTPRLAQLDAGLAAFLVQRLLSMVAVLGVLYLLLTLTHVALVERLAADAPRTRAIAANLGVGARRLGLLAALLSGVVCLLLIVGAFVLIVGPLEVTPADFQETLRRVVLGFRVSELNVSFAAVLATVLILLVALIIMRALPIRSGRCESATIAPRTAGRACPEWGLTGY